MKEMAILRHCGSLKPFPVFLDLERLTELHRHANANFIKYEKLVRQV
jgi:hypothetical protein